MRTVPTTFVCDVTVIKTIVDINQAQLPLVYKELMLRGMLASTVLNHHQ